MQQVYHNRCLLQPWRFYDFRFFRGNFGNKNYYFICLFLIVNQPILIANNVRILAVIGMLRWYHLMFSSALFLLNCLQYQNLQRAKAGVLNMWPAYVKNSIKIFNCIPKCSIQTTRSCFKSRVNLSLRPLPVPIL